MFSKQAPNLAAALRQAGFNDQQASALLMAIGNCTQALTHNGPITLGSPDPAPIGTPGITEDYALNIEPGSSINNEGDMFTGGDAIFDGDTNFGGDNTFETGGTTDFGGDVNFGNDAFFDGDTNTFFPDGVPAGFCSAISGCGGGSDIFVAVNSSGTGGYLEDRLRDNHVEASAQYNATQDFLIESDTVDVAGEKKSRFYVDSSDLTNFSSSALRRRPLGIDQGASAILIQGSLEMGDTGTTLSAGTTTINLVTSSNSPVGGITTDDANHTFTTPNYGLWYAVYNGTFYYDSTGTLGPADEVTMFFDLGGGSGNSSRVTLLQPASGKIYHNVTLCQILPRNTVIKVRATAGSSTSKSQYGTLIVHELFGSA